MKRWGLGVVLAMVVVAQPAWAARTAVHEAAESPEYGRKAGGMLGRGVLNAATCFVDVIVHLVNDTKAGPPVVGTLTGIAKGAGCGVLRLGSGVIDVATFWVPGFNGLPVSDSYDDCLAVGMSSSAGMESSGERDMSAMEELPKPEPLATSPATPPSPSAAEEPITTASPPSRAWKK